MSQDSCLERALRLGLKLRTHTQVKKIQHETHCTRINKKNTQIFSRRVCFSLFRVFENFVLPSRDDRLTRDDVLVCGMQGPPDLSQDSRLERALRFGLRLRTHTQVKKFNTKHIAHGLKKNTQIFTRRVCFSLFRVFENFVLPSRDNRLTRDDVLVCCRQGRPDLSQDSRLERALRFGLRLRTQTQVKKIQHETHCTRIKKKYSNLY